MAGPASGQGAVSSEAGCSCRQSIKTKLLLITGCLAALAIAVLGYQAVGAAGRYASAIALDRSNAAGNRLVIGIYEVLLERLATNNALQADALPGPEARDQIAKHRQAAEDAIASGLPIVLGTDFPNKPALSDALRAATDKAVDLRRRADASLGQAKAQRDADLLKTFIPGMTDYVNASLRLWTASLHAAKEGDPVLARYASLKQLGWLLREISGLERSIVAAAIASHGAIPPAGLQQINGYRAQVALAWKLVQDLTADADTHALIKQAIAGAKERYFAGFEPLADKMRQLSQEGGAYPMLAADWVSTTNPQIDSLLAIMTASGTASEELTADVKSAALREFIMLIVGISIALALTAFCLFTVIRRITAPLGRISRTVLALAGGDLKVEVTDTDCMDEIGEVARSVDVFKKNALTAQRLEAEQGVAHARKSEQNKTFEFHISDFDRSVSKALAALGTAATELRTTATGMSATAEETTRQAGVVTSASGETSSNVQTVAASAEEMARSIASIDEQVTQASSIARQAVEDAQRTNGTVNTLAEAAQKIGQVVQLIQDIASQTNLLALNATIEAARAGEAGKGFAVVASEVKSLANQTAKATEEIAGQIGAIQTVTREAVVAIQGIGGTIGRISEISSAIAGAIKEQGAAMQEIARNTQQAAVGTGQVSASISGVNAAAGETGAASAQVLAAAEQLGRHSETLRADVKRFLERIRAA